MTSNISHQVESRGIDPAVWNRFAAASTADEYYRNWLALQCSLIPRAALGLLAMGNAAGEGYVPVARWPEGAAEVERLAEVTERALAEGTGLLVEMERPAGDSASAACYGLAYPVMVDDRPQGVVAVEVRGGAEGDLRLAMMQLQWGAGSLELRPRRERGAEDETTLKRLKGAVDLLAGALAEEHFIGACMAFVTELSTLLACDRVSLGFVRRGHAVVQAVSHSSQFGKRMNLNRAIGTAMDEAITQRCEINYPLAAAAEAVVTRDHETLARQYGMGALLTLPLYGNERYYAALTLERSEAQAFEADEAEFCRSVAGLVGPALEAKRLNDRLLTTKIAAAAQQQATRLLGPRYTGRKLIALLVLVLVLFGVFAKGEYRLAADTTLEGAVRRVLVAPFNGYIHEAPLRAGDVVESGQLVCRLDDRDLRLERLRWRSQQTQLKRQIQEAQAAYDRAQVSILSAQLAQAEAQLELAESRLERTRIRAPFDGLLVSGDLSQRLGSLAEEGEVLFELTPLNAYRVMLEVDERRIADVRPGQRGALRLSSLPEKTFDFSVEKITPISATREGANYFRVEAQLDTVVAQLRPGMEGVGKISVDRRRLVAIWSRDLVEWLQLWLWSWWP